MNQLYIVATPIGNLKDITIRALEVLSSVDFILCEDTRVTSKLLNHFNISKELVSFNAHMESKKLFVILARINSGQSCALVSDAGTPCISDPGVRIVNEAYKQNVEVISIPGPSAVIAALSIAGLPTDAFVFEGFLPQKKGRQKLLNLLSLEERTIVIYESVHRIRKLMSELNEFMPGRMVAICKELTKKFEQIWRGKPSEFSHAFNEASIKGEFVVIISPINWTET